MSWILLNQMLSQPAKIIISSPDTVISSFKLRSGSLCSYSECYISFKEIKMFLRIIHSDC